MKNALIFSVIVAMVAAGFFFGPDLFKSTNKEQRLTPPVSTAVERAPAFHEIPSLPVRPIATPSAAEKVASAPKKIPVALRRKAKSHSPLNAEVKRLPAPPFVDGAARPERAMAAETYTPRVSPAKLARREKNFENPMEHRWVKELSGQTARLNMGKKKDDADLCSHQDADNYPACQRHGSPQDVSVAGVIVSSDNVVKRPMNPLDGDVSRGGYATETPAVYVK